MSKKLFIWTTEYDVLLSLAETEEEARTNIFLEAVHVTDESLEINNFFIDKDIQEALKKEPIILESGATILYHGNE